ncbi:syncytin-1-like [Dasypus novemcinctus]|uniref:syncytin-1-like n=1 Tax=Dasypus novemcinctus TaxID=9361 RepID=UPI00265D8097|nr:syncytin-1-like [Dasypus novemcinctus]
MHSSCYIEVQSCTKNNKTYYTAKLACTKSGNAGGNWGMNPNPLQSNHLVEASCLGTVGDTVCWNKIPPVHVSDGGGPQDQARQVIIQERIEEIIRNSFPQLDYHPLALPKTENVNIDAQTFDILMAAYKLLNESQPDTAQDCWLCLHTGDSVPLALPAGNRAYLSNQTCAIMAPTRVQPIFTDAYAVFCLHSPLINNSHELHLGHIAFAQCSMTLSISNALCTGKGTVFICGNNLAYTFLPSNWTGTCTLAILFPDVDIVGGTEPVPIPRVDFIASCSKRAIQFVPLLATLGISGALAIGTAGLGISINQYTKLSKQLIDDVQDLSSTIQDIQDELDSLAEVVLQNRRGLDLLTAEHSGICLALQERCCFYANKSGIVRDKVKKLQEDLEKRRKELADNPLWSGMNGLLPFLGTSVWLLLLGPILFNKIMAFLKQQLDAIKMQPIQVHYHRLDMADYDEGSDHYLQMDSAGRPDPRPLISRQYLMRCWTG